jgi:hypothetical protein
MPPLCWYVVHLSFGWLKVLPFVILLSFWEAGIYSGRLDTYICSGIFRSHANNMFDATTFTKIPMFCIVNYKLWCVIYSLSYQSVEGFMFQVRFFFWSPCFPYIMLSPLWFPLALLHSWSLLVWIEISQPSVSKVDLLNCFTLRLESMDWGNETILSIFTVDEWQYLIPMSTYQDYQGWLWNQLMHYMDYKVYMCHETLTCNG